jgi:hypothetical protein
VVSITANVTLAKMKPTNLKPLRSTIVVLRRFFGVVLTIGRTVFGSGGSKGAARYQCLMPCRFTSNLVGSQSKLWLGRRLPQLMLWTAPPEARECQGVGAV